MHPESGAIISHCRSCVVGHLGCFTPSLQQREVTSYQIRAQMSSSLRPGKQWELFLAHQERLQIGFVGLLGVLSKQLLSFAAEHLAFISSEPTSEANFMTTCHHQP